MITNESGRSMVEMLGVLAIIGVLSVAGIAGYSMAMNKYKANEMLNNASQAVILAEAEYAVTGKLVDGSNSEVGNAKATMTATGAGTVTITGCTDTQEPCKTAKSSLPSGGKIAGFSVTFSAS